MKANNYILHNEGAFPNLALASTLYFGQTAVLFLQTAIIALTHHLQQLLILIQIALPIVHNLAHSRLRPQHQVILEVNNLVIDHHHSHLAGLVLL